MVDLGVKIVLEQRDAPRNQGGDPPRLFVQVLEMGVPGEGHEDIGQRQQDDRLPQHRYLEAERGHVRTMRWLATAGSQAATLPRPGMTSLGAISASGCSTKARRCRRGCGRVRRGRSSSMSL